MASEAESDKHVCSKCGVILDETNWYRAHSSPRTRYLANLGKFYALRLFVCKKCWQKRSKEAAAARRRKMKELDPENVSTRYTGIRLVWRGDFIRRMTSKEVKTISMEAEKIVAEKVLPAEGFDEIVWLHNHHMPFDICAKRNPECYLIDVTTASYKSFAAIRPGNRQALGWLIRNTPLRLLIVYVAPDFSRYLIKSVPEGSLGSSIHRNDLRYTKPLEPGILEDLGIQIRPSPNMNKY